MAFVGHGTFNSNKTYFVLIAYLIKYRKNLAKITAKCLKKSKTIVEAICLRFQTWVCQNVSNEVLSAWFKFQAKIPTCFGVYVQGEWQKYTRPSLPLFKDEGMKDIGHSMNIRNLILGVNSVTASNFIRYESLLQNTTDIITKYNSYFITKCKRSLLQNASGFLLQNATVLLQNMTVYYKIRQ